MNRLHEPSPKQVSQVPEDAGVPAGGFLLLGVGSGETI